MHARRPAAPAGRRPSSATRRGPSLGGFPTRCYSTWQPRRRPVLLPHTPPTAATGSRREVASVGASPALPARCSTCASIRPTPPFALPPKAGTCCRRGAVSVQRVHRPQQLAPSPQAGTACRATAQGAEAAARRQGTVAERCPVGAPGVHRSLQHVHHYIRTAVPWRSHRRREHAAVAGRCPFSACTDHSSWRHHLRRDHLARHRRRRQQTAAAKWRPLGTTSITRSPQHARQQTRPAPAFVHASKAATGGRR
jgi:hypothetical protein